MATRLEDLVIRLTADNAELRRELAAASRDVGNFKKNTEREIAGIGGGVRAVRAGVYALLASEVAQLTTAFARGAREALDYGDSIAETAERLGLATDSIQALRYQAAQSGVEIPQLDQAFARFSNTIGRAANGVDKDAKKFSDLGISLEDSNGVLADTETLFERVAQKVAATEDPVRRVAIASEFFGQRAGAKLIPILLATAEGFDKMVASAREAGAIIDEDTIQRAAKYADTLDALAIVVKAQLSEALTDLAPIMVWLAEQFVIVTGNVNDMIAAFKDVADLTDRQLDRRIINMAEGLASTTRNAPGDSAAIASQREELAQLMAERDRRQQARANEPPRRGGEIMSPVGAAKKAADEAARAMERLIDLEEQYLREAAQASGNRLEVLAVEHDARARQLEELRAQGLDVYDAWIASEAIYASEVHKHFEERKAAMDDLEDRLRPRRDTTKREGRLGAIQDQLDDDLEMIDEWAEKWNASTDEVAEKRVMAHARADEAIRQESDKTWTKVADFAARTLGDAIASWVIDGETGFAQLRESFLRTLVQMGADAAASGLIELITGLAGSAAGTVSGGGAGGLISSVIGAVVGAIGGGGGSGGGGGLRASDFAPRDVKVSVVNEGPPLSVDKIARDRSAMTDEVRLVVRQAWQAEAQRGEFVDALGQRHAGGVG